MIVFLFENINQSNNQKSIRLQYNYQIAAQKKP